MATCTINLVSGEYDLHLSPEYEKVKIFVDSDDDVQSLTITSNLDAGHCVQIEPSGAYDYANIKKLELKGTSFCFHRTEGCLIKTMTISCGEVTYGNDVIESCN